MESSSIVEPLLFYLAFFTLLFFVATGIEFATGNRSQVFLKNISPSKRVETPRVSVIIPARNEEKNIEVALRSMLNQDYENVETIVVDDRSTDSTGAILDRMAQAYTTLRTFHILELPQGWLGKTHALYFGTQQATGKFLLFTDADVVMEPGTASKAMSYMIEKRLDHLAVAPVIKMPGVLLNMFAGAFAVFFGLYARPWRAKNPKSSKYIGIGAFNLVRTQAYYAIGTHQAIAMRPDDDMKLGKLLKKHRFRQEVLFGKEMIFVEWYTSLRELIRGLMKNSFAGIDYNLFALVGSTMGLLSFLVWPFLGVFLTSGVTKIINGADVFVVVLLYWDNAGFHSTKRWYGIGFPIAVLIFIYILWKSALTTIMNDGINWRDTHYSLSELKANRV